MNEGQRFKFKDTIGEGRPSAFQRYRELCYGEASLWYVIKAELITTLTSGLAGALGLALRRRLYPGLFKACGRGVVFGRNLTLRHARKISLGENVVLDDNAVVDAKGGSNRGIEIGDNVYVGRNTIIYCKNGDVALETGVNISSNCQIFSSNRVTVGAGTVIAAYTYILSGGRYDPNDRTRTFAEQEGTVTRGPTTVGRDCWLAAGVVIADGVTVGGRSVIGAGSVVLGDVPPGSLAVGAPARPVRRL